MRRRSSAVPIRSRSRAIFSSKLHQRVAVSHAACKLREIVSSRIPWKSWTWKVMVGAILNRRYHPCNKARGFLRNVDCGITYSVWLTDSDPPRAVVHFIATHVNGAETLRPITSSYTLDPTGLSHIVLERYAAQVGPRDDYIPNHQITHDMVLDVLALRAPDVHKLSVIFNCRTMMCSRRKHSDFLVSLCALPQN